MDLRNFVLLMVLYYITLLLVGNFIFERCGTLGSVYRVLRFESFD